MSSAMDKISRKIKKVMKRGKVSSEDYADLLRSRGALVGKGTFFTEPSSIRVDSGYPYCVEIGDYVTVTSNVVILAHDYSYSVLSNVYGIMPQNSYKTTIGNNVFIGKRAIILPGS